MNVESPLKLQPRHGPLSVPHAAGEGPDEGGMAGEVQQIYTDVDRAHRRGLEMADARAQGVVVSLAALVDDEVSVGHAHRDVAVGRGPQAHQAHQRCNAFLHELRAFALMVTIPAMRSPQRCDHPWSNRVM